MKNEVKKYQKGEIYLYLDKDNDDKPNISDKENLLVGTRPALIIKSDDNTSLIAPFTRSSYGNKIIKVHHYNDIDSYLAHDMIHKVNNNELGSYISTINNMNPIISILTSYISGDDMSTMGIIQNLHTNLFIPGQIWKKKEGPFFLLLKVISISDKDKESLLLGVVLDQSKDNNFDFIIKRYDRKLVFNMNKLVTISSDCIDYYEGSIDPTKTQYLIKDLSNFILLNNQPKTINFDNIHFIYHQSFKTSNQVNKTSDPILGLMGLTEQEMNELEAKYKTDKNNTCRKIRYRRYTEEEKQFILDSSIEEIMKKFDLTELQAYKTKSYRKNSLKKIKPDNVLKIKAN